MLEGAYYSLENWELVEGQKRGPLFLRNPTWVRIALVILVSLKDRLLDEEVELLLEVTPIVVLLKF